MGSAAGSTARRIRYKDKKVAAERVPSKSFRTVPVQLSGPPPDVGRASAAGTVAATTAETPSSDYTASITWVRGHQPGKDTRLAEENSIMGLLDGNTWPLLRNTASRAAVRLRKSPVVSPSPSPSRRP